MQVKGIAVTGLVMEVSQHVKETGGRQGWLELRWEVEREASV